jgi:hypothetical protein
MPDPVGGLDLVARARCRLAGWSVAIAVTGIPATVAVQVLGHGAVATAGTTVIGTITVAALATARFFLRDRDEPSEPTIREGGRVMSRFSDHAPQECGPAVSGRGRAPGGQPGAFRRAE